VNTAHASLMDGVYRWQTPIYDLTRKYYLLGRDRLIAELDPSEDGGVLEVGCGTGRNLAVVARRYPAARLYGFDISKVMLDTAAAKLDRRAALAQADAATFDPQAVFGRNGFERVFCAYTLSMIPDWRAALGRAFDAVAPGGRIAVVDFSTMRRWPGPAKAALRAWLAAFHVTPRDDLLDVFASFAAERGFHARTRDIMGGYAIYATAQAPV
jgi:S-adenosylmethionine-diacylgycerolhomoserine-N-methlytransferase